MKNEVKSWWIINQKILCKLMLVFVKQRHAMTRWKSGHPDCRARVADHPRNDPGHARSNAGGGFNKGVGTKIAVHVWPINRATNLWILFTSLCSSRWVNQPVSTGYTHSAVENAALTCTYLPELTFMLQFCACCMFAQSSIPISSSFECVEGSFQP